MDPSGACRLAVEVSRTGERAAAVLELHAGERRLASLEVPVTGDRHVWTTVTVPLAEQLEGVHDLRIVLTGEQRLRTLPFTS